MALELKNLCFAEEIVKPMNLRIKSENNMISVIICTYNHCESLKDTLVSLLNQERNKSIDCEVIVVDNNSNDETKNVVKSFASKFNGRLRYIFEPRQGKSYALNTGIHEAKGEIVAFTDDDVIVNKQWLLQIQNTFASYDCDGLGGKILPLWKGQLPKWLTRKFWGFLALLDYGDKPFYAQLMKFQFYGANFAFKKQVLKEIGMFSTLIGPKGKKLSRGEDTELFFRLLKNGKKLLYHPRLFVLHSIREERINKQYFKKWNFDAAQSNYFLKNNYKFSNIFFDLIDRFISYLWCRLKKDEENMVYHEVKLFSYFGLLKEKLKI